MIKLLFRIRMFLKTLIRLRSPKGCSWDRNQTPTTLAPHLIEEAYELIDAISKNDYENTIEEIGDTLLISNMIGLIYEEQNPGSLRIVYEKITEKLIRRHPHVFSNQKVSTINDILKQWDEIKKSEKKSTDRESIFENIPTSTPPLEKAFKIQKSAAKVGFDWKDYQGPLQKIHEEILELTEAVNRNDEKHIEEELGDLLFSVINLSRKLKIKPNIALHKTNSKFIRRFKFVQEKMNHLNMPLTKLGEDEKVSQDAFDKMEEFWQKSKNLV